MIFFWILVIIIVLIFSLDQLIARMYQYEAKTNRVTPKKYQIPFEEVTIPGVKGAQLYGWWMPTAPNAPTLILGHGWGRNLSRMMPYIRQLHPLGYNLLAFDARNHGRSSPTKRPTVHTFSEDTLAAIDFIAKSGLVSSPQIGIVGLSIGGGAAINAASRDGRIQSIITIGALSHPVDVMSLEFHKKNIPNFIPRLLFGYMRLRFSIDFDKIAPVNNIPNVKADILLIHGDADDTIPLSQGQALAEAGDSARTCLWVVPGKGHSDCDTHPQFWEKVAAFLQETTLV